MMLDCVATLANTSENSPNCANIIPIVVALANSIDNILNTIVLKNTFHVVTAISETSTTNQCCHKNFKSNINPTEMKNAIKSTFFTS